MFRRPSLLAVLASAGLLLVPLNASAFPFSANSSTFERAPTQAPVVLAQTSDVLSRIQRLEDEVRRLNGRVEELSFQLLQAQEDMRRAQENNELRFQDLEGGAGASGSGDGAPAQRGDLDTDLGSGSVAEIVENAAGSPDASSDASSSDTALSGAMSSDDGTASVSPSQPVAASPGNPGAVYNAAYDQLLAGDYASAEQSFRQYVQTYPDSPEAADAQYWLGESLYQQELYADAAEVFLNAQKEAPNAAKAPDMMLKLGMSLAALGNGETACITFNEVGNRYPDMSDAVRGKLAQEQQSANC